MPQVVVGMVFSDAECEELVEALRDPASRRADILQSAFTKAQERLAALAISGAGATPGRKSSQVVRRLYSTAEAAELVGEGVTSSWIRQLCKESPTPIARSSRGDWRITDADIRRWRTKGVGERGLRR